MTGESLSTDQANVRSRYPFSFGPEGPEQGRTTSGGANPPGPFWLYEMHGNVRERCDAHMCMDAHETHLTYPLPYHWPDRRADQVIRGGSYTLGHRHAAPSAAATWRKPRPGVWPASAFGSRVYRTSSA